jgi:hypothetical protein
VNKSFLFLFFKKEKLSCFDCITNFAATFISGRMYHMTPNEVADRYFVCVRARDIEGLIGLYADDATITLPDGSEVAGAPAIRTFQEGVFARGAPFPTPGRRVISGDNVAVEIRAELSDGRVRRTANFFTVNGAGRIQRLSVYSQGS